MRLNLDLRSECREGTAIHPQVDEREAREDQNIVCRHAWLCISLLTFKRPFRHMLVSGFM